MEPRQADSSVVTLNVIGYVRSDLLTTDGAPKQGHEGASDAWVDIRPDFAPGLTGVCVGDDVVLLTWLHRADRDVLEVHPRDDATRPLAGVFATRSSHRPNPIGLHRVSVLERSENALRVAPLEAIDGTPVVDIKAVLSERDDT